ncbi:Y-family DNA polymerase [Phyllobacterium lublinensis]|uniref:Y-family DNA polymerase n=1 Tax=Phyllobacterium lublinensis TaxID=2875708 RepID=UPI001CC9AE2E|nr:DNA polymerase Y family protein [Phyllobacterium sp. 2063]MBZ9654416.1 DNA polymerase Y family protein [Phyllobacterium sp. 2063]
MFSDSSTLFLALWFPHLPTDRLKRENPERGHTDQHLIVVDKIANALRLTAVDERAAKAGLHMGLALTDARAQFDHLDIAFASPRKDKALLERLADWCDRYTPLVAFDEPHGLILDMTGCIHLFGDEPSLVKDIHKRLHQHGMIVRSALASNAAAARALARHSQGGVVNRQEQQRRLYALPLVSLAIEENHLAGLKRAGLRSIGDVDVLPRAALTARFGNRLVNNLDAMFGRQNEPISPRRIIPVCMAERRMAEPLIAMESVELVLQSLARDLFLRLQQKVEGAREVEASFFRADGNVRRISIQTGRPVTETKTLLRLLKERLSTLNDPLDAGYGFDLIRLAAIRVERTQATQESLDNRAQETGEINTLVDRLSIRLGNARVLRPVPVDTHIPERAVSLEPAAHARHADTVEWNSAQARENPPERPIRLFEPPERIDATFEIPDAAPAQFVWRKVRHTIVMAEGPERIAPEWWREHAGALTRDYYRLEDSAGKRFWVFREGLHERGNPNPRWYLHGLFA